MLTLSHGSTISDEDLWSLHQGGDDMRNLQTAIAAATDPNPMPGGGSGGTPSELAGKTLLQSAMPWKDGTRMLSPGALSVKRAWVVSFTAGAANAQPARFQAAEWGGGPIQRAAILYRKSDGLVLGRFKNATTVTFWLLVGSVPAPHSGKIGVDSGQHYAVAMWNPTGETGAMFAEIYV